jgi:gas vesicle protein
MTGTTRREKSEYVKPKQLLNEQLFRTAFAMLGALVWWWLFGRRTDGSSHANTHVTSDPNPFDNVGTISGSNRLDPKAEIDIKHEPRVDGTITGFVPGLITGGVVGGLIGAAAALWFAPQSGEETQEMLRKEATHLKQSADESVNNMRAAVENAGQQAQQFVNEQVEKTNQTVSNVRNAVAEKI